MQAAGKVAFHAKLSKLLLHDTRLSLSLASPKIGCRRSPYASAMFKQGNGLTWFSAQPGLWLGLGIVKARLAVAEAPTPRPYSSKGTA